MGGQLLVPVHIIADSVTLDSSEVVEKTGEVDVPIAVASFWENEKDRSGEARANLIDKKGWFAEFLRYAGPGVFYVIDVLS
jgi:hypothetical protein